MRGPHSGLVEGEMRCRGAGMCACLPGCLLACLLVSLFSLGSVFSSTPSYVKVLRIVFFIWFVCLSVCFACVPAAWPTFPLSPLLYLPFHHLFNLFLLRVSSMQLTSPAFSLSLSHSLSLSCVHTGHRGGGGGRRGPGVSRASPRGEANHFKQECRRKPAEGV